MRVLCLGNNTTDMVDAGTDQLHPGVLSNQNIANNLIKYIA